MADVFRNTAMITGFVFTMMLLIEYLNVITSGVWQRRLSGSRFGQYVLASFLGVVPGCLGAFAVVAMYSHRMVSLGAVVAAMIATSGDETFVMLAIIPKAALFISAVLFVVGIIAGVLTDTLYKKSDRLLDICCDGMELHEGHHGRLFARGNIVEQWRNCSAARGIITIVLVLMIAGVVTGQIAGDHEGAHEGAGPLGLLGGNWIKITLILTSMIALFIVATVDDHFLKQHLWGHIARRHLPRIFLWTLGTLLVLYVLTDHLNLDPARLSGRGSWVALLAACLVGLIPESGPHLVFVTLYAQGYIPLAVLLAGSIVQDGHGMLPVLAHSRRVFVIIKLINLAFGLAVGALALWVGI